LYIDSKEENVTGQRLLTIPINPTSMGERLRRLASCYETYRFQSVHVKFVGARGTGSEGTIAGFFDFDPVDTFDSGDLSLREASAHPSFAAHKVWEECIWRMPSPPKGRYYVGESGNTSADKRLQQQGNFHILIDVPTGSVAAYPCTLGGIYFEYHCVLMKPTLQANFVGTFFRAYANLADINPGYVAVTFDNALTAYESIRNALVTNPQSNWTPLFHSEAPDNYGWILTAGAYYLTLSVRFAFSDVVVGGFGRPAWWVVPTPSAATLMVPYSEHHVTEDMSGTEVTRTFYSNQVDHNGTTPWSFNADDIEATNTNYHDVTVTAKILVPGGAKYLVMPVISESDYEANFHLQAMAIEMMVAPTNSLDDAYIKPSSEVVALRLSRLEKQLASSLACTESKSESKEPVHHDVGPGICETADLIVMENGKLKLRDPIADSRAAAQVTSPAQAVLAPPPPVSAAITSGSLSSETRFVKVKRPSAL
jgi:hypothetical protein